MRSPRTGAASSGPWALDRWYSGLWLVEHVALGGHLIGSPGPPVCRERDRTTLLGLPVRLQ